MVIGMRPVGHDSRSADSVRPQDLQVSLCHELLKMHPGNFYIHDQDDDTALAHSLSLAMRPDTSLCMMLRVEDPFITQKPSTGHEYH